MTAKKKKGQPLLRVSGADIARRKPEETLVPFREITPEEGLAIGFRMEMITTEFGGVSTGAGLGSDWIIVTWKDRYFVIRGVELLALFAGRVSPEDKSTILNSDPTGRAGR
jgi:hypothetical protein